MKFLVCFDHTAHGLKTLETARTHAEIWKAQLLVVQAISRGEPLSHRKVRDAEEQLAEKVDAIVGAIPHDSILLVDSLERGEQLVAFARKEQVDQIFLGIEKKSKVGKLLFGSTAQYVILRAPCPVLTVG